MNTGKFSGNLIIPLKRNDSTNIVVLAVKEC